MERFTGRCTGKHRCNERTTQTHLLKLNGRVPRMSLGSSFQRDLLHTAARLPKKVRGHRLHKFLYQEEHLTNDIGHDPCHLPDIPYDAFCITV